MNKFTVLNGKRLPQKHVRKKQLLNICWSGKRGTEPLPLVACSADKGNTELTTECYKSIFM
jgi:hypothetical protein